MKISLSGLAALACAAIASGCVSGPAGSLGRQETPFDADWRFLKSDAPGAERPDFNDAAWKQVNLPHDWGIEGPFAQTQKTGRGGGFAPSGVSWYRKTFTLPAADASRQVFIDFDGIMANSEVWVNGFRLGKRPYGYVSFRYELTGHLNFGGKPNVIAVRTDTTQQPASHFYTGQGIYRHVRLVVSEPVRLEHHGVFVTTPKVAPAEATVRVQSTVTNTSGAAVTVAVVTTLSGPDGLPLAFPEAKSSAQSIPPGQSAVFEQDIPVTDPKLWDVNSPNLYLAKVRVTMAGATTDAQEVKFGIRSFEFKADTGFWLNGRNLRIYGACLHEDGGAFGMAVPVRVWERRLEKLRELGINAIRTVHNPPAPEFLALCDRLGFLVMLETFDTWRGRNGGAEFGYNVYFDEWWERDLRDIVLRDRNHPSLIIYSLGNEIRDNLNVEKGRDTFIALRDLVHKLDPTRPVTLALFRPNDPSQQVYTNGFAELMDVVGQDYRDAELIDAWRQKPARKIISTATGPERSAWLLFRDSPFLAGQFVWCAVDYPGEADWPFLFSSTGLLDRTGGVKLRGLERQSWWAAQPVLNLARYDQDNGTGEIVQNWTPAEPGDYQRARIAVFSNCEEVEVFHNGESLGTKPPSSTFGPRVWSLAYAPGVVKAVGRNGGQIVATQEMRTAGPPAKIVLTADRSRLANAWDDVAFVTATVTDKDGIPCPNAENKIAFKISGPGVIAAVDNADNGATESFQAEERAAYRGQCVALIKASASAGRITFTASSPGLATASLDLEATPSPPK